jgi:hypothetical protein
MNHGAKSILAIGITIIAVVVLSYFVYSFIWFVLSGRRKENPRTNTLTMVGFLAVMIAVGLCFFASASFGSRGYGFERLVLFTSVGLCIVAIAIARFGSSRTIVPIVTAALVVALNAIGAALMQ